MGLPGVWRKACRETREPETNLDIHILIRPLKGASHPGAAIEQEVREFETCSASLFTDGDTTLSVRSRLRLLVFAISVSPYYVLRG